MTYTGDQGDHPEPTFLVERPDPLLADNAGPWAHDDGTPCAGYWARRPTADGGVPWWCTEHQQHVHATPPAGRCDMGCQPDWHHDECAIYLPAAPDTGEGDREALTQDEREALADAIDGLPPPGAAVAFDVADRLVAAVERILADRGATDAGAGETVTESDDDLKTANTAVWVMADRAARKGYTLDPHDVLEALGQPVVPEEADRG